MVDVAFHPEARAEYLAARAWYQARSPRAAAKFEAEVEHTLAQIGATPDLYPSYDEEHRFAVLHRFPYSLVYQTQLSEIVIVAVVHASRDAGYWKGRG